MAFPVSGSTSEPLAAHAWGPILSSMVLFLSGLLGFGAALSDYQVIVNDFWGCYVLASQWDGLKAESLWSGFHPVGYLVILKAFSLLRDPARAAGLLNVLFAAAYLWSLGSFAVALLRSRRWGAAAVLFAYLQRDFLRSALGPGPDMGSMTLSLAGMAFLCGSFRSESERRSHWLAILAGVAMGGASLLRYYGLAMALSLGIGLAMLTVLNRSRKGILFRFVLALLATYSPQLVINASAGHWPLETHVGFNAWIKIHGINWYHVTGESPSLWKVIEAAPAAFCLGFFRSYLTGMAPCLLLAVNVWKERESGLRDYRITMLFAIFVVSAIFSIGGSPRAALPLLSMLVLEAFTLAGRMTSWMAERSTTGPVHGGIRLSLILALAISATALSASRHLAWYGQIVQRARARKDLERELRRTGVTGARELFIGDFGMYFVSLLGSLPHFNGSWLRLEKHLVLPPPLEPTSWESLHAECRRRGISHLVLAPGSEQIGPLFGELYAMTPPASNYFRLLKQRDGFRLFQSLPLIGHVE